MPLFFSVPSPLFFSLLFFPFWPACYDITQHELLVEEGTTHSLSNNFILKKGKKEGKKRKRKKEAPLGSGSRLSFSYKRKKTIGQLRNGKDMEHIERTQIKQRKKERNNIYSRDHSCAGLIDLGSGFSTNNNRPKHKYSITQLMEMDFVTKKTDRSLISLRKLSASCRSFSSWDITKRKNFKTQKARDNLLKESKKEGKMVLF